MPVQHLLQQKPWRGWRGQTPWERGHRSFSRCLSVPSRAQVVTGTTAWLCPVKGRVRSLGISNLLELQ